MTSIDTAKLLYNTLYNTSYVYSTKTHWVLFNIQPLINSTGIENPKYSSLTDRFLNTATTKIYTSTSTNIWNSGEQPIQGYAVFDKTNRVGYVFDGTIWVQFNLPLWIRSDVFSSATSPNKLSNFRCQLKYYDTNHPSQPQQWMTISEIFGVDTDDVVWSRADFTQIHLNVTENNGYFTDIEFVDENNRPLYLSGICKAYYHNQSYDSINIHPRTESLISELTELVQLSAHGMMQGNITRNVSMSMSGSGITSQQRLAAIKLQEQALSKPRGFHDLSDEPRD